MRLQSAITAITRSLTVAFGLFAPGHLGELTPYVPFELVDAVLEETGRVQRRPRALPSRVGVYFVLALTLFHELSYQAVWQQLTSALGPLKPSPVSGTALRHLRRRLTPAPFKTLLETLAARRRRRDAVTEIAAGSGLYRQRLFDNYTSFSGRPAALFAQPVVRRPDVGVVTVRGGGYPAPRAATGCPSRICPRG